MSYCIFFPLSQSESTIPLQNFKIYSLLSQHAEYDKTSGGDPGFSVYLIFNFMKEVPPHTQNKTKQTSKNSAFRVSFAK